MGTTFWREGVRKELMVAFYRKSQRCLEGIKTFHCHPARLSPFSRIFSRHPAWTGQGHVLLPGWPRNLFQKYMGATALEKHSQGGFLTCSL